MKKSKRINHLIRLTCLAGAVFCYSAVGYAAVMSNATLPENGNILAGGGSIGTPVNNIMDISGLDNTVIKWDSFNIGSVATVNFSGEDNFNVLNYVASGGSMSQIHGTMNAFNNGNVYLVNPAGVFIGKSAQIDVGSLYVSNKKIDDDILKKGFVEAVQTLNTVQPSSAELMSLGHINATKVTFDGNRIVLDTEYVTNGIDTPIGDDKINIITNDINNVVLGYDGYNDTTKQYQGANEENAEKEFAVNVVGQDSPQEIKGYMWIENVEQLQAMNTNPGGNYALRNGIDATNTAEKPFEAIENFEGKLDGLAGRVEGVDFSIFDLHVGGEAAEDNQGLFANTDDATLKNLIFVSGSTQGSGQNIGTLVGSAVGGVIENVKSSSNVTGGAGSSNVGGIVGRAEGVAMSELLNTGKVEGTQNVGGLVGSMAGGSLTDGRNIGQINGVDNNAAYSYDIGGIAGSISGGANLDKVENALTVTGGYNVGGIAGSMDTSTIENATNSADITANRYKQERYVSSRRDNVFNEYDVYVANVGGIVGSAKGNSKIENVTNDGGNVQSYKAENVDYYQAGNVGGIVGKVDGGSSSAGKDNYSVNIRNAINKENAVYGAHNVGGIAGYLENGTINSATNNGGDIMATGARNKNVYVSEIVGSANTEAIKVGNIGGIVGYMYGDNAFISQAGNRGGVHSMYFSDLLSGKDTAAAEAGSVGGIVGKVDRSTSTPMGTIKADSSKSAISDSYNTGAVQGYTAIGGIAGLMYNGEIVGSYNLGNLSATRAGSGSQTPINLGGIVGDSTENTPARIYLYDVYNSGVIGSTDFANYYGRHVGGVVGRLSGDIEKVYNTGAIYNGSNVVGGLVGYLNVGNITDSFNTGNVTVYNQNSASSQVGGLVGALNTAFAPNSITNAYNLGTIRSFRTSNASTSVNSIGGLIGSFVKYNGTGNYPVTIENVYTSGNLYGYNSTSKSKEGNIGAIYGQELRNSYTKTITNAYYIAPENEETFTALTGNSLNGATSIDFNDRTTPDSYAEFIFSDDGSGGGHIDTSKPWRIYAGSTTPILNAFLPKAEEFFAGNSDEANAIKQNIQGLQYGTAYNPMLTIINAKEGANIELDWAGIGATKGASFAVNNGSLTLNNFDTNGNYFGGTLYADGALTVKNVDVKDDGGDIMLGSGAKLYGSSVTVESKGELISYGSVQSTGKSGSADIMLSGGDGVEIIGAVKSAAQGEKVEVLGIDGTAAVYDTDKNIALSNQVSANINDASAAMPDVAEYYGKIVTSDTANGNVEIKSTDGDVKVLFGVAQNGYVDAAGSLSFTGSSVYVDSDVKFGDQLTFTADEAVLDISNIGKVQTAGSNEENAAVKALHSFLAHGDELSFVGKTTTTSADGTAVTPDAIIAVDMWNDKNKYDGQKYDLKDNVTFDYALHNTSFKQHADKVHVWLDDAEQLQSINDYYKEDNQSGILTYNFALKNDIDANSLKNFHGIGYGLGGKKNPETDSFNVAFTGNLDGRGYSIVGLSVTADSSNNDYDYDYVGLFSRIGEHGSVKDLNIISSNFTGSSVGAVAGRNEGTIENVTTFGNRVTSDGSVLTNVFGTGRHHVGAAGGITGINQGTVENVTASDAVIAGIAGVRGDDDQYIDSTAGGIAGVNVAKIKDSVANSAVTSSAGDANALGGVIGINYGSNAEADVVESLGIVNGKYKGADASEGIVVRATENIGGIAGVSYNGATISNAYNEAHISGSNGVGGIVGYSGVGSGYTGANNTITNAVNAGSIIGSSEGLTNTKAVHNTGGLVGNSQNTSINTARNTGAIHGEENVGGMVGTNGENSTLNNVTNDGSATIYGNTNVGGVAGVNEGRINAEESQLINNGTIYGNNTVGGIAGLNTGTIKNTNSNITLYATGKDAMYFGGVAGRNEGTITSATNTGDVLAENAGYVGGITGVNGTLNSDGSLEAGNSRITGAGNANSGTVTGANYVGGVAGLNAGNVSGQDANPTEIRNDGYVHATAGGAGGIFGVNEKTMQYVTLVNGGIVYGEGGDDNANSGTGGVIGVNSGNISKSDMIGEAGGVVIGSENVGGLIGVNTGSVAGGRDEKDNYYAHQVYNNGTVVGGTYKEALEEGNDGNSWTAVDADDISKGYYSVSDGSSNIGGLVGSNDTTDGSLTLGYNTGDVKGDSNVGGIAGSNAGTIDQVFSVGGVAGNVSGLVGVSKEDGRLTNAHGNGVTNINDDNVWKTYGDTKVLKNFLTKLNFESNKNAEQIVYNAHKQSIIVKAEVNAEGNKVVNVYLDENVGNLDNKLILLGYFDTTSTDENAAHSLADYFNTLGQDDLSNLLMGKEMLKDGASKTNAGEYKDIFASQQINISGKDGNPNNLGFDIEDAVTVNKATIQTGTDPVNADIVLDAVQRIYGDTKLHESAYGWKFAEGSTLNEEMQVEISEGLQIGDIDPTNDSALEFNKDANEWRTNSANGDYQWTWNAELNDLFANYTFSDNSQTAKLSGASYVNKKELTLKDVLATITYGQTGIDWEELVAGNVKLDGVVYGDDVTVSLGEVSVKDDSGYATNKVGRDTADVKVDDEGNIVAYQDSLNISDATLAGEKAGNYAIAGTAKGDIKVNRAGLTINVWDAETTYGTKFDESKYSYTFGENAGLVNGDAVSVLGTISYTNDAAKDGTNGVWTKDAGSYKEAVKLEGLNTLGNYDVTVNAGDATVNKAELTITLNDVTRVYGNLDKADYGYNVDNLTNGDTEESLKLLLNVLSDGAIAEGTIDSPTKTSDAGSYEWTANVSGAEGLEKNYNVKVTDGKSDVTKAHITITVNDQTMPAGGDQPQYTGNISGITNGDSDTGLFGDYSYGPQDDGVAAEVGKHTIGITIDGQYYDLDSSLNNGTLSENYTYEIKSGTLTVTDPTDPTDPIDPTDPSNPDVWQAEDKYPWYQWDKQRNERERKAEVHFVDGGMAIH